MSTAKGRWYQSESKLKIPRSNASFVVRPQWAKTTAMTPTVITRDKTLRPAGGGGVGGFPPGGGCGGQGPDPASAMSRRPEQRAAQGRPPTPPTGPAGDAARPEMSQAITPANRRDEATRVQA